MCYSGVETSDVFGQYDVLYTVLPEARVARTSLSPEVGTTKKRMTTKRMRVMVFNTLCKYLSRWQWMLQKKTNVLRNGRAFPNLVHCALFKTHSNVRTLKGDRCFSMNDEVQ